jgi:hypothetical protein
MEFEEGTVVTITGAFDLYVSDAVGELFQITGGSAPSFDWPDLLTGPTVGMWLNPAITTSVFTTSAGSTQAAQSDPVGRVEDLFGNGRHATQANTALRHTLSTRVGEPMMRINMVGHGGVDVDSSLDLPAALQNKTGCYMWALSMNGVEHGVIDTNTRLPFFQFMEMVIIDRIPNPTEIAAGVAKLESRLVDYHDIDIETDSLQLTKWAPSYYTHGYDYDFSTGAGASVGLVFQTTAPSALCPPDWDGNYGYGSSQHPTVGEYADFVIASPSTLNNLGVTLDSGGVGKFATTQVKALFDGLPALESVTFGGHPRIEGFLPDASLWPSGLQIYYTWKYLNAGTQQMCGRWPDFSAMACKDTLEVFVSPVTEISGPLDLSVCPNLRVIQLHLNPYLTSVDLHGLANLASFGYYGIGGNVRMTYFDSSNCPSVNTTQFVAPALQILKLSNTQCSGYWQGFHVNGGSGGDAMPAVQHIYMDGCDGMSTWQVGTNFAHANTTTLTATVAGSAFSGTSASNFIGPSNCDVITDCDIHNCTGVGNLICYANPLLVNMDVSGLTDLIYAMVNTCPSLTALNFAGAVNLADMQCQDLDALTTFYVLDSPLIHRCILNGHALAAIDLHGLTLLNEVTLYPAPNTVTVDMHDTATTSSGFDHGSSEAPLLKNFNANGCDWASVTLDGFLAWMDAKALSGGNIDIRVRGGIAPGTSGLTHITNLVGRSYTVLYNP